MNITRTAAVLALVALTSACASFWTRGIRTETISESVGIIVERHDGYVINDELLTNEQEAEALAQSAALSGAMQGSSVGRAVLRALVPPVLDRHDTYVQDDASLRSLERRTYLRSSAHVRVGCVE